MSGAHAATPAKITSIGRWDSFLEGIGVGFQVGEEIIRLRLDADSVKFLLECLPDAMNGYADLSHMLKSSGMPKDDLKWLLYEESAGPLNILAQLRAIREVLRHTLAVEPMTPEILTQMPSKRELVDRLRIPGFDQGGAE